MTTVAEQVVRVAGGAGLSVDEVVADRLSTYFGLLAKWNSTLNLTGFDRLDPAGDDAVGRLLVEPLAAAPLIPNDVQLAIDVGSGGGSPSIPLKLARPEIRFVLVESKARKSAFLREAVRHLQLEGVDVATSRFEDLEGRLEFKSTADLVTVRAVRLDEGFWKAVSGVLRPGGYVMLFGTASDPPLPAEFEFVSSVPVQGTTAVITLGRRSN